MEIVPAIDIIDGKCVRLSKGDSDTKKVYHEDPREVAKAFADWGVRRLHVVDLDGAKAGHIINHISILNMKPSILFCAISSAFLLSASGYMERNL